jgi:hypothetical protein
VRERSKHVSDRAQQVLRALDDVAAACGMEYGEYITVLSRDPKEIARLLQSKVTQ